MELVWQDEFNGDALDPKVWYQETGDGTQYGIPGWGNEELEWYQPENVQLRDGKLVITSRTESQHGYDYTSGRINTKDRVAVKYGRIEARIKLPAGQGVWPAFWMMPQEEAYGTWAASGEIDIMEAINLGVDGHYSVHGTLHYGDKWPENTFTGNEYSTPKDPSQFFHTYAVQWDEHAIHWYVDDTLYATQNKWSTAGHAFPAPFDQSFYILLNVAIGGKWPGNPDASTVLPVEMEVDYVRVYSGITATQK